MSERTGTIGEKSAVADRMRIDWDVPIPMDDGIVLRADVFRPIEDIPCPVILSYGPCGKGLPFQVGYRDQWNAMVSQHPDVTAGSTNKYQNWEIADPEKWVPHGYACVRIDSRGGGRSPVYLDVWSPRETRDLYDCIEWAGTQAWSSGKVGLLGISYYAINQWTVASLQPPHLTAICPWEGVTFVTAPLDEATEIIGPVAVKLFIASSTVDADVFTTLRVFDLNGDEVDFQGALDPRTPIGQGWLRSSHRKLDPELSAEYRPYHTHDEQQLLEIGEAYELDVEIWPTCIVIPPGYRIALTIQGKDFERPAESGRLGTLIHPMRGSGPFTHTNPRDRPPEIFDNQHTIFGGGVRSSYLLLPVIPSGA